MAGGNLTLPEKNYRQFFVLSTPTESFCMRCQVNFLSLLGEGNRPICGFPSKELLKRAGDIGENTTAIAAGVGRAGVLTYRRSNE